MRPAGLLLIAALLLVSAVARADPASDAKSAEALFWEGRAAAEANDYAGACKKFEESLRIDRSTGTLFNLAHSEEKLRRFGSATRHYREAAAGMKPDDARLPIATTRADELASRAGKVTSRRSDASPVGLEASLDGEPLAIGEATLVDPGAHQIEVRAPGRAPRTIELVIAEAQEQTVTLEPGPEIAASEVALAPKRSPVPPPALAADRAPSSARRVAGWSLVGLGAAGLVFGGVAGAVTFHEKSVYRDHCDAAGACADQEGLDAARRGTTWGNASTVAFVAGAAVVIGGVVLVLTSPSPPAKRSASSRSR